MKFTISVKDTAMSDSINDAARDAAKAELPPGLSEEEAEAVIELRVSKMSDFANKWTTYGEYVDVEFDTDAGTATLVKRSR